ncbi:MAG TPA: hypothetical protein VGL91_04180, partial [Acidobacteriota bacterium]
ICKEINMKVGAALRGRPSMSPITGGGATTQGRPSTSETNLPVDFMAAQSSQARLRTSLFPTLYLELCA